MDSLLLMFTDRRGKYSIFKILFFLGALVFLAGWVNAAYNTKTVPPIDASISTFLGVLGGTSLIKSHLSNKKDAIPPNPPAP